MALSSVLAPIAGAAISAGVSSLFGKKESPTVVAPNPFAMKEVRSAISSLQNPQFAGFSGGGLNGSFANGTATVTADPSRSALVGNIADQFGTQLSKLRDLAAQIAPGASQLRAAQLDDIANRQASAVSSLRQNLQNRRVLGSSFAQDAINRTNETFAAERAKTIAQTYQQEIEATHALINEQAQAGVNQFKTYLDESNLQASIAGQLSAQAQQVMSNAQQVLASLIGSLANQYTASSTAASSKNAELGAQEAQNAGSFWATLAKPVANAVSGEVKSLFTPTVA